MARPRPDEPIPAQRRNVNAVHGPSLSPVFNDLISFVDDILQYSRQIFEALQALGRRHNSNHLGRIQEHVDRVERVKTDISDVQRSHFDGLRRLCTDRQPECIVLDELHTLLAELRSVYRRLLEISRDVLHDEHAGLQCESFQEFDDAISKKIKTTGENWEHIPHHSDSPLCHGATRMIECNDIGSISPAHNKDHQERGILRRRPGVFQHWHCPDCLRIIKFFVETKNTSLELAAFPPRIAGESFHNKVAWRDVWCSKSHLKPGLGAMYACLLCLGEGRPLDAGQAPRPKFNDRKDLIKHIAETHHSSTLPKVFMQKLHITKASDKDEERSDLKFLRE